MKILVYLVSRLDNAIYKTIGWASPIRRAVWARRSKELQRALNYQHTFVSEHNACRDIAHTGKYCVEKCGMIDSVYIINHPGRT